ncbi:calcium-activated chloride channel regulator 1-like [Haemaphysalis longicornis]
MFMPYFANLSHFCDDNDDLRRHNAFAPSKQNALCDQRSTWEVISGNDDFKACFFFPSLVRCLILDGHHTPGMCHWIALQSDTSPERPCLVDTPVHRTSRRTLSLSPEVSGLPNNVPRSQPPVLTPQPQSRPPPVMATSPPVLTPQPQSRPPPVMTTSQVIFHQPRTPNAFHGEVFEDVEDWLVHFERVADFNRWDDREKMRQVYYSLEDGARTCLPKPDMSKRIQVKFQEKQKRNNLGPRTVLVLDASGSMSGTPLEFVKVAVKRYITDIEDNSRRLAIVAFSDDAEVLQPLMAVNASTRQEFLGKVAGLAAAGAACIGCGLEKALELLNTTTEKPEGAMIILLTDAEENARHPNISTMTPKLKEAEVTVNTFALGVSADKRLEDLAMATRGTAYTYADLTGNFALELESVFASSSSTQLADIQQPVTVCCDAVEKLSRLEQGRKTFKNKLVQTFLINEGVGNKTVVIVDPNNRSPLNFTKAWLVDPSGKECQECKQRSDNFGVVISIPSMAKVGTWTLHLETDSPDEITVTVKVNSMGDEPIHVFCKVSHIKVDEPSQAIVLARVTKGKQVVLNAVVQAVVTVVTEYGETHKSAFQLHDNGGGEPDTQADDGWYSGYFTEFVGKGRYSVSAYVSSQDATQLADALEGSRSFSSNPNVTVVFGVL